MAAPLRILADENIPHAVDAFGTLGVTRMQAGRSIGPDDVRDVDVLLVRSVTTVEARLLEGSNVRFVGSATIGTDHIDTAYLKERGIHFAHAPGSNAESVVEYVLAALLRLSVRRGIRLEGRTVGIVGCGNIGGLLARRLPALGVDVLQNDPPLAERADTEGRGHDYVSLEDVLDRADVVTLHVPLTREGPHATHHLVDADVLRRMRSDAWLVNASRGPVVDNAALREALAADQLDGAVLDVWEGEPTPDAALMHRTDVATPHIAGYSYDGKVQGTAMLYDAVVDHFGLRREWDVEAALAPSEGDHLGLTPPDPHLPLTDWLDQLARRMYDVSADDTRLRASLDLPEKERGAAFGRLRKTYPRRRAFSRHCVTAHQVPTSYRTAAADGLGVRLCETCTGGCG